MVGMGEQKVNYYKPVDSLQCFLDYNHKIGLVLAEASVRIEGFAFGGTHTRHRPDIPRADRFWVQYFVNMSILYEQISTLRLHFEERSIGQVLA